MIPRIHYVLGIYTLYVLYNVRFGHAEIFVAMSQMMRAVYRAITETTLLKMCIIFELGISFQTVAF